MIEVYAPPFKGLKAPAYRARLAQLPTPIRPFSPPGFPSDVELWIKRDDMTECTLSGNKIRKLEFLLAEAIEEECDAVITCGGIQSNHCRATALAARQLGLEPHLLLRTPDTQSDPGLGANLLLDRMAGAELKLITPDEYPRRQELMQAHAQALKVKGLKAKIIPEGGSNATGTWGYLDAAREIKGQTLLFGFSFDRVVTACGSGGTAAGLALGTKLTSLPTRVCAVNVCDSADFFYDRIGSIFKDLGSSEDPREALDILDGYTGEGYAVSTEDELRFLADTARETGIVLDPVYTGKALYGLMKDIEKQPWNYTGQKILFLHTGGVFGLYDKTSQLAGIL